MTIRWHRIIVFVLSVLLGSSTCMAAKAKSHYLYKNAGGGDNPSVIDLYIDPNDEEAMEPDFLYQEKFPHHRVVEFYSPLCPHCVKFAPNYIEFARKNRMTAGVQVDFYAVSCTAHKDICRDQGIKGYPSLKIFPKGTSRTGIKMNPYQLNVVNLHKALGVTAVDQASPTTSDTSTTKTEPQEKQSTQATDKEPVKQESVSSSETLITVSSSNNQKPPFLPRQPTELFTDAYMSFHTAMKTAVFMEAGGKISPNKKKVLGRWIKLMHQVLPPWRIHNLLEGLLGQSRQKFSEQAFMQVLDQYPPPENAEYSIACQLHESPYTCGLWTLFHIMTVGVVEFNTAAADPTGRFDVQDVSQLLRDFVQHFLLCDECTQHFTQEYDACSYDRCTRLKKNSGEQAEQQQLDDWKELALWLLETHNGVNLRLALERITAPLFTSAAQQSVMWPQVTDCPTCWLEAGGSETAKMYNKTMMWDYIRLTYWTEDYIAVATREELSRLGVKPQTLQEVVAASASSTSSAATDDDTSESESDFPDSASVMDNVSVLSKEVRYSAMVVTALVVLVWNKRRVRWLLTQRDSRWTL
ncbi:Sulfhydryl oxidase 1 [Seminavis robusta]|uniref:Sulfhydryl oxidase n=1 Tax=Seminavis robusta TaxID=568900 RepID=A0A9N8HR49_9STRA|nr:Sulfhydryl oxidase 1 [Seminavis robusta]|eukprot:Sro1275_g258450.1 Sulfhydryl oxidase 1 (581) ;mRNA; r:2561-4398